jgi:hypothetical protein
MFKLIQRKRDMPIMLYNLAADPAEKSNLAEQNPDIVKSMTASFQQWSAQMIEPTVPGVDMKEWSRAY